MFESPPDVAKYEEQASLPLTISFLSIGLNLAIFTDFSWPFKCPSIFQLVHVIKGEVYIPPTKPDVAVKK